MLISSKIISTAKKRI